ncbi:MAG: DUF4169 family protein [Alphaproteobacteria bacterium]|jgi:molecular chaperone DnaK (HSP70)|nr:DUF4169 domain-containing protein [Rhodobiaceae bacterium]MBO6543548.1 DUF4169 family protein [Alphaproteobacteria bacterium]MBO6627379.1 DUF4169 family protein [Alphaproteobacteria bacterium]MDF1626951.1 DUF4169 family protein [Parvibaculaceae bacterium]|tara:strand:+ start:293 stop:538 length:246 start_codon:yes stop_codon:yes gene_type:complete
MDSKGKNIVDFTDARKNLRRKKKDAVRAAKEQQAAENRTRYGRTGAEKKQDRLEKLKREEAHAAHQRLFKKTDKGETDKHE